MADTLTPNIGAVIPDPTDTFNFPLHVSANFTLFDSFVGLVKCTSSTRPSTTFGGQGIYETDTRRVAVNNGTLPASAAWEYKSSVILSYTSSTRPAANLVAGMLIYETDTDAVVRWTGSAWHYETNIACTSSTRPNNAASAAGTQIYETDTKRLLISNGSLPLSASWEQKSFANFVCTSGTHPASPFAGLEIYETDTTASAIYSGSAYLYGAQQVGTVKLGAPAASMSVSSIPAFNQLIAVWTGRQDSGSGGAYAAMQFNGDAASHYTYQNTVGNVTSVTATNSGALTTSMRLGVIPGSGDTANYFGCGTALIGSAQSAVFKPMSCSYCGAVSATNGYSGISGGLWASTAAVTQITVIPSSGNLIAGSSLTVYGLM